MKLQLLSAAVHDLIGDGKTENALALLKQEIPSVYPKGMIDVTMLKSRYNQAHDDFSIRGVISNTDFDARVSQINLSTLEFLERISKQGEKKESSSSPSFVSSGVNKVKPALKITTPGLVILFSRKTLIGLVSIIVLGIGSKYFFFNTKHKVEEKKPVVELKSVPSSDDTLLLKSKLKEFETEEARERLRLERKRNNALNKNKNQEPSKNRTQGVKKPVSYSNEMDTIKPVYAPAPKKIILPSTPELKKNKGA